VGGGRVDAGGALHMGIVRGVGHELFEGDVAGIQNERRILKIGGEEDTAHVHRRSLVGWGSRHIIVDAVHPGVDRILLSAVLLQRPIEPCQIEDVFPRRVGRDINDGHPARPQVVGQVGTGFPQFDNQLPTPQAVPILKEEHPGHQVHVDHVVLVGMPAAPVLLFDGLAKRGRRTGDGRVCLQVIGRAATRAEVSEQSSTGAEGHDGTEQQAWKTKRLVDVKHEVPQMSPGLSGCVER